jgi:hypothetical protein
MKVDKNYVLASFLIFTLLLVSSFFSIVSSYKINFTNIAFAYKYFFVIILPIIVVNTVRKESQKIMLIRILFINFVFLSSWVWIYLILRLIGIFHGSLRPSFPFSNEYNFSDAHLYASYLSFFLVAYILYIKRIFNHKLTIAILVILNSIIALFLTGSRTSLIVTLSSMLFWYIAKLIHKISAARFHTYALKIFRKPNQRKKTIKIVFLFIIILVITALIILLAAPKISRFSLDFTDFLSDVSKLVSRSIYFNLNEDQSFLGRIEKLKVAFSDSEYACFIIGKGFFSSLVWYDNIFAALLAHGGFVMIYLVLIFSILILSKILRVPLSSNAKLAFITLLFNYFLSNLITEFVFVSRNSFPIIVFLTLIYRIPWPM